MSVFFMVNREHIRTLLTLGGLIGIISSCSGGLVHLARADKIKAEYPEANTQIQHTSNREEYLYHRRSAVYCIGGEVVGIGLIFAGALIPRKKEEDIYGARETEIDA